MEKLYWARFATAVVAIAGLLGASACGPQRTAVIGPINDSAPLARATTEGTRLTEPTRIDFAWELNESGARVKGVGVARVEPPYRARLDLFLEGGETVISAALVDDDLRLPAGAPDGLLPPVDLMWGTLGVFRPVEGTTLAGGDRLENGGERLRYRYSGGNEIHYEIVGGTVVALELLEGASVVQWVRLEADGDGRYPASATYRNLVDFRELKILRTALRATEPFADAIWDPR
ncbi:MAG: hypothetical protein OSA81_03065 [Longimicrobiales bacterium]|nr:hypothetical protein [Longimicrobiales bacterium]